METVASGGRSGNSWGRRAGLRPSLHTQGLLGYLSAAVGALIWASYSLMTKWVPAFPTGTVGAFCLVSGVLSLGVFLLQGGSVGIITSLTGSNWVVLVLLGIGPMGAAFFAWDAALKRGDPRVVGSLVFLTPLLATAVLAFLGGHHLTRVTGIAGSLIVAGSVIGSLDALRRTSPTPTQSGYHSRSCDLSPPERGHESWSR